MQSAIFQELRNDNKQAKRPASSPAIVAFNRVFNTRVDKDHSYRPMYAAAARSALYGEAPTLAVNLLEIEKMENSYLPTNQ
jgi:hypothetical protein